VHGIDVRDVARQVANANIPLLLFAAVLATIPFYVRALRWRTILDPIAPGLPLAPLWRSIAVGVMATNLLPARPGEFARAFALTRETDRIGFSAIFASIVVDRVFDAVAVLLLLLAEVVSPGFPKGALTGDASRWIIFGASLCVAALGGLFAIVFFPAPIVRLVEWMTRPLPPTLRERLRKALVDFTMGLGALRSPTRFFAVLGWSIVQWMINGCAFWMAFVAVGIHAGYGAALFLQGVVALGVAAPSSPGFVGVFEGLAKKALPVFGVSESLAVTWAVAFHIFTFIPITVIGLYYLWRLGAGFGEISGRDRSAAAAQAP
ncbi:MAG: flippase-like domain-containing protein, partial [Gemmatimonadota bacterium]|nr:flippase-like domain-containing protein [Gemmatimonadota bacterium]